MISEYKSYRNPNLAIWFENNQKVRYNLSSVGWETGRQNLAGFFCGRIILADDKCKGIWIPIEILENEDFTVMEKLFFVKIDSLDKNDKCYANNRYFSEFFNLSITRTSEIINSLIKKGCIEAEYHRKGKQIVERVLKVKLKNPFGIVKEPLRESSQTPSGKFRDKSKGNNKVNIKEIYSVWDNSNLTKHSDNTLKNNIKKRHLDLIKDYGKDEVIKAIQSYSTVLHDKKYYWTHKYTFWDFIGRGLAKFLDECKPLENWLENNNPEDKGEDIYAMSARLKAEGKF